LTTADKFNQIITRAAMVTAAVVLSALIPSVNYAQVYQPIEPPPVTLPTIPFDSTTAGTTSNFDAFGPPAREAVELRPWQTLDIPVGSWGDSTTWGDELNGTTIERFRKAFVQKVELTGGYVHRGDANDLGYSSASAAITMVVPLAGLSNPDNLLVLTPGYRSDWIQGPANIDVPGDLQSASIVIGWRRVFNDRWSLIAGVQPGIYNDRVSEDDGFRLTGLALMNYKVIPEKLTVTFGVVYTGRNDVTLIPGVGLTWIPEPNTRFELNFPKPRLARRISHLPFVLEDWVYVFGAFGGGEWAVRRTSGIDDELTLQEFRAGVGFERILNGGTGFNIDIGYVFGRELEYLSNEFVQELDESFMIEAGLRF